MASDMSVVSGLYSDLNSAVKTSEWDKVLTVSNRVLQESPDEQKAFQCKTAALIHLGKFEDCLRHLKPAKSKFGAEQKFERAYCQYRLNRLAEALATLEGCETPREQELRAQVLYRLERYDQALQLYRSLVRGCADDYGEEREVNMAAACAARSMFAAAAEETAEEAAAQQDEDIRQLPRDTYDQLFNAACALIGRGRLAEAGDTLAAAERACREALADEADAAALTEELAPIQFQQAYLSQVAGGGGGGGGGGVEPRKVYQAIANAKLADAGLLAVCANNLVCANRDQNLFDSKKRVKFASSDALKQKLTRRQRQAIAINQCLVYLHSNQGDLCKRTAESLLKSEPDNETAALILAAQLARERATGVGGGPAGKPGSQAIDFLKSLCAQQPEMTQARLALAQLLAQAGSARRACDALKELPPDLLYTDRFVSTVMRLYASVEDRDAAAAFLAAARRHFCDVEPDVEKLKALLKLSARFEQSTGNHRQAADLYAQQLQLTPNDQRLIARLVHAYAQFDPPRAEETSRLLRHSAGAVGASAGGLVAELDVDQLESSFAFGSKYSAKRTTPNAAAAAASKDADAATEQQQPHRPKKKKGKLPKNYDPAGPPADAERWLPRRERSYYRGKKKDKQRQMMRGPQGATAAAGDLDVRAKQVAAAAAATAAADASESAAAAASVEQKSKQQQQQQQQQAQSSQQQKKKKQRGGRW